MRSLASRAPSGSSSSSTFGSSTSARASATRCCWPPDSWRGLRPASSAELDELERLVDPPPGVRLVERVYLRPKATLSRHGEEREQRVGLEDRVDRPLVRWHRREVAAVEQDLAGVGVLEPGDHPQRRGLAAAGRPEQREELAGLDLEVEAVDGTDVVVVLDETPEGQRARAVTSVP